MKNLILISLIVFLVYYIPGAEETASLSLKQCIDAAVEKNPVVKASLLEVEQAKRRVEAESYQPNPELTLSAVRGDATEEANSISQRLLIFGQIPLKKNQAQFEYEAVLFRSQGEIFEFISTVKTSYFKVLFEEEKLNIARANLEIARSLYKIVESRYKAGEVPRIELSKGEIEMNRIKQALISQEKELERARAVLCNLMQIDTSSPPNLEKTPPYLYEIPEIEILKETARKSLPFVLASQSDVRAAEAGLKVDSSFYLPEATISYYQPRYDPREGNGLSLSLSFPIFDWGGNRAKAAESKAAIAEAGKNLETMKSRADLEIEESYLKAKEYEMKIIGYQEGILNEAESLLRLTEKGYEKGALRLIDVLEAQRTLISLKLEYQEAILGYRIALVELEKAIGKSLFTEGITQVRKTTP